MKKVSECHLCNELCKAYLKLYMYLGQVGWGWYIYLLVHSCGLPYLGIHCRVMFYTIIVMVHTSYIIIITQIPYSLKQNGNL